MEFHSEKELWSFISLHLIGFTEVMELLKCTQNELRELVRSGKLRPRKETARDSLFWKKEVLAYLKSADEVKLLRCIRENYGDDVQMTRLELGVVIGSVICPDCCRNASETDAACHLEMVQLADNEGEIMGLVGQCPQCRRVYYFND
ncbi:MAG TPA: hypothetical protein VN611_14895 [Patescibacteria group bacterium]|nr:hypothetical protein [Patescibacteria group bacterium]